MIDALEKSAFKRRQVWLWGDIDDESTYFIIQQLNYLCCGNSNPIYILINSKGGDMDCECLLIDEIEALKRDGICVNTIALGTAYSAAASVLAMGTKGCRFANPNSSIMLHPCSIELDRDYEGNQKLLMEAFYKKTEKVSLLISRACGITNYEKFSKDIDKGLWLNAEEAIQYGVVDYICRAPLSEIGGE